MIYKTYQKLTLKRNDQQKTFVVCNDFDSEKDRFILLIPEGVSGKENMAFHDLSKYTVEPINA